VISPAANVEIFCMCTIGGVTWNESFVSDDSSLSWDLNTYTITFDNAIEIAAPFASSEDYYGILNVARFVLE
jgi:hypothetical protein